MLADDPAESLWRDRRLPGKTPKRYAVYVDDQDQVWLTDFDASAIVRFDPERQKVESYSSGRAGTNLRQLLSRGPTGGGGNHPQAGTRSRGKSAFTMS